MRICSMSYGRKPDDCLLASSAVSPRIGDTRNRALHGRRATTIRLHPHTYIVTVGLHTLDTSRFVVMIESAYFAANSLAAW